MIPHDYDTLKRDYEKQSQKFQEYIKAMETLCEDLIEQGLGSQLLIHPELKVRQAASRVYRRHLRRVVDEK